MYFTPAPPHFQSLLSAYLSEQLVFHPLPAFWREDENSSVDLTCSKWKISKSCWQSHNDKRSFNSIALITRHFYRSPCRVCCRAATVPVVSTTWLSHQSSHTDPIYQNHNKNNLPTTTTTFLFANDCIFPFSSHGTHLRLFELTGAVSPELVFISGFLSMLTFD